MIEENRRQVSPANSGIAVGAVETADNRLADARGFDRVLCIDQSCGQGGQLGTAQLSLGIKLIDETNDTGLFVWSEALYFVDNLRRRHGPILVRRFRFFKSCSAGMV